MNTVPVPALTLFISTVILPELAPINTIAVSSIVPDKGVPPVRNGPLVVPRALPALVTVVDVPVPNAKNLPLAPAALKAMLTCIPLVSLDDARRYAFTKYFVLTDAAKVSPVTSKSPEAAAVKSIPLTWDTVTGKPPPEPLKPEYPDMALKPEYPLSPQ